MTDTPLKRFLSSMVIDQEKWRDGIGYDMAAIDAASDSEKKQIEAELLKRSAADWRDIEGLARLGTPKAREALLKAATTDGARLCGALLSHAPQMFAAKAAEALIIQAIEKAELYDGFTQALNHVPQHKTQAVIDALFEGCLTRDATLAYSLASMLMFVHGLIPSQYDMSQRQFLLRFSTPNIDERRAALNDLKAKLRRT